MKVNRRPIGSPYGRQLRPPIYDLAPPPEERPAAPPRISDRPAEPWFRRWRRRWKAALTLGLLAETAVGGFMAPAQPAYVPSRGPMTLTVMPTVKAPTAPTIMSIAGAYHPASGGEYLPNAAWQAKAAAVGQEAAEHLASSVVDLANRQAGNHQLTPEFKRHLIQVVMAGIGGLDPDDAGDILEVASDNAGDMRLGPLSQKISEWFVPGPRQVSKPPDDPPAVSDVNRFLVGGHEAFALDFSDHPLQLPGFAGPGLAGSGDEGRPGLPALSMPLGRFFDQTLLGEPGPAPAAPTPPAGEVEEPGGLATGSPAAP